MELNPDIYKLPARTKLRAIDENHIGIVKLIKSRIIQKDAVRIVEMSKQIKGIYPDLEVSLISTSNICSKSLALLQREGISVVISK